MTSGYHRYIVTRDVDIFNLEAKLHAKRTIVKGTLVCDVPDPKPHEPGCKVITIMPGSGPELEVPADALEPVFVLRAQDILGPQLVRQWAERAASANCPGDKIAEAKDWADVMDKWPTKKYPD